jgi:hypothetical protein
MGFILKLFLKKSYRPKSVVGVVSFKLSFPQIKHQQRRAALNPVNSLFPSSRSSRQKKPYTFLPVFPPYRQNNRYFKSLKYLPAFHLSLPNAILLFTPGKCGK